jgi:hypothetical protein
MAIKIARSPIRETPIGWRLARHIVDRLVDAHIVRGASDPLNRRCVPTSPPTDGDRYQLPSATLGEWHGAHLHLGFF